MTPHWIRLKNFTGIQAGLGRDEIVIDLDKLTDGAALVAIVGPNGAGKSTLLDNLTPFRIMPSRASRIRRPVSVTTTTSSARRPPRCWNGATTANATAPNCYSRWAARPRRQRPTYSRSATNGGRLSYQTAVAATARPTPTTAASTPSSARRTCFSHPVFAAQNRRNLSACTNGEIKACCLNSSTSKTSA